MGERLDYAASVLGTEIERPAWMSPEVQEHRSNWTAFESSLSPEARKKMDEARFNTRLGRTMGQNQPENFPFNATGIEPPPTTAELRKIEQEKNKKLEAEKQNKENMAKEEELRKEANRKAEEQRMKDKERERMRLEEQSKNGQGDANAKPAAAAAVQNET